MYEQDDLRHGDIKKTVTPLADRTSSIENCHPKLCCLSFS